MQERECRTCGASLSYKEYIDSDNCSACRSKCYVKTKARKSLQYQFPASPSGIEGMQNMGEAKSLSAFSSSLVLIVVALCIVAAIIVAYKLFLGSSNVYAAPRSFHQSSLQISQRSSQRGHLVQSARPSSTSPSKNSASTVPPKKPDQSPSGGRSNSSGTPSSTASSITTTSPSTTSGTSPSDTTNTSQDTSPSDTTNTPPSKVPGIIKTSSGPVKAVLPSTVNQAVSTPPPGGGLH